MYKVLNVDNVFHIENTADNKSNPFREHNIYLSKKNLIIFLKTQKSLCFFFFRFLLVVREC